MYQGSLKLKAFVRHRSRKCTYPTKISAVRVKDAMGRNGGMTGELNVYTVTYAK